MRLAHSSSATFSTLTLALALALFLTLSTGAIASHVLQRNDDASLHIPLVPRHKCASPQHRLDPRSLSDTASKHRRSDDQDANARDNVVDWTELERRSLHLETRYVDPNHADLQRRQLDFAKRSLALDLDFDPESTPRDEQQAAAAPATEQRSAVYNDNKHGSRRQAKNRIAAGPAPARAPASAAAALALQNIYKDGMDQEYLAAVRIGTPGTLFHLVPDSGSSDTWLVSSACSSRSCDGISRSKYDLSASSTYQKQKRSFSLDYSIGKVSGSLFRDLVSFPPTNGGGAHGPTVNTTLGLTTTLSSDWKNDAADGIMGLGFRGISARETVPIYQNLVKQDQLANPMISFAFGRKDAGTEAKSEMVVGGMNADKYQGDIKWYELDRQEYWEVAVRGLGVGEGEPISSNNNRSSSPSSGSTLSAIFDTGTSLIALPSFLASAFWSRIAGSSRQKGTQYYTYPCSTRINAYLEMKDGTRYEIDEKDLNIGRVKKGSDRCVGGVLVAETKEKMVLGLAFLKNVYLVLKHGHANEKSMVGLALSKL